MTIRIQYTNGHTIDLHSVQTITLKSVSEWLLIDGSEFEITCFGNSPTIHRHVLNLDITGWGK